MLFVGFKYRIMRNEEEIQSTVIENVDDNESTAQQLPKQFLYAGAGLAAVVVVVAVFAFMSNLQEEGNKELAIETSRTINIYLSGSKDAALTGSGVTVRGKQIKSLQQLSNENDVAALLLAKDLLSKGNVDEAKKYFSSLKSSSSPEMRFAGLTGETACENYTSESISSDNLVKAAEVSNAFEDDNPALLYAAIVSNGDSGSEKMLSTLSQKDDYLESTGMAQAALARLKYVK